MDLKPTAEPKAEEVPKASPMSRFEESFHLQLQRLLPRFVRCIPNTGRDVTPHDILCDLREKLQCSHVWPVRWLPGFFAIPGYLSVTALGSSDCYFPMDASSGYVAKDMKNWLRSDSVDGKKVLDLCCCPGGKLMNIAVALPPKALLVGVDISARRMDLCKSLVRKHLTPLFDHHREKMPRVMLFVGDGTLFSADRSGSLVFDSTVSIEDAMDKGHRKRRNKSSRGREKKLLKLIENEHLLNRCATSGSARQQQLEKTIDNEDHIEALNVGESKSILTDFDIVFVDAECSHDGSFRHMSECERSKSIASISVADKPSEWETPCGNGYRKKLASEKFESRGEDDVVNLQKKLIDQGYSLLKVGGTLVYSTCSLSTRQNEEVVQHLLHSQSSSRIIPMSNNLVFPTTVAGMEDSKILNENPHSSEGSIKADFEFCSQLLSMDDSWITAYLQETSVLNIKNASDKLSQYVADLNEAPYNESRVLPGTVTFNRHSGTSGLFLAVLQKQSNDHDCKSIGVPIIAPTALVS